MERIDAAGVERLAAALRLAVDDDEAAAFADEINRGLGRYDALGGVQADESAPPTPEEVTLHPDEGADPLNAFTATFELSTAGNSRLAGLDVAVKDNVAVAGVPLTCGSAVFRDAAPGRHAVVVERLLAAGARLVGKTNMDELAYGPTGETSAYGPTRNPVDPDHVAGGSSAGSAAAVGAGDADAALGTDTGGSVRIPASFCGVVGFKPTWGVVPATGVVEMARTLDTVGPIAPDVETAARVLDAVAGPSDRDPTSERARRLPVGEFAARVADAPPLSEFRFAVLADLAGDHVAPAVSRVFEAAVDRIEAAGATVDEVSLPALDVAAEAWDAVTNPEFAAALLTRLAPVRHADGLDLDWHAAATDAMADGARFGDVVRSEAIEGAHLLDSGDGRAYVRGRAAADRLRDELVAALADRDALLAPTMPVVAPELGAWGVHGYTEGDGPGVPLSVNVRPANLAGAPALSVPCGDVGGLPVGLQFLGAPFDDARVLRAGRTFESDGGE